MRPRRIAQPVAQHRRHAARAGEEAGEGHPLVVHHHEIARAEGGRGPNAEYLFNTPRHLAQMGVEDLELDELAGEVRRLLHPGGG